jgi:hypothetical protein
MPEKVQFTHELVKYTTIVEKKGYAKNRKTERKIEK